MMTTDVLMISGKVSSTSLELPKTLDEEQWKEVGNQLKTIGGGMLWWLGDWWAFGEQHEYRSRKEFVDNWKNGYSYGTCRVAGTVSKAIPVLIRINTLPWSYHRVVASLEPEQQKRALQWAKQRWPNINESEFKDYIRSEFRKKRPKAAKPKRKKKPLPNINEFMQKLAVAYDNVPPQVMLTKTEVLAEALEDAEGVEQDKLLALIKAMDGAATRVMTFIDKLRGTHETIKRKPKQLGKRSK